MGSQRRDFAEFYRESCDDCLRTIVVTVGDRDTAQDLVLVFHINPSALPPGAGVQIATSFTPVRPGLARSSIESGLVYASPQCTGS